MLEKLDKNYYKKDALRLAKDLLGKFLVYNVKDSNNGLNDHKKDKILIGKIIETEAYMGYLDKGSHTYNGKRTKRTEAMYGEAGTTYVYLIYGMYNCLNVVAADVGIGQAVLIRALEPIRGCEKMSFNRFGKPFAKLNKYQKRNLTNGPGKLCMAFGITRALNKEDLTSVRLYICREKNYKEKFDIVESKRIGIDYAEEAKDFLWRFYIKENKYVSIL